MEKKIICITCPLGCEMTVKGEGANITSIKGHACKRGEQYARDEFIVPVRILTTSVAVNGAGVPLVPVRSAKPLPKDQLPNCMQVLRGVKLKAPVHTHDVIVKDILGTGVDIIASGSV